MKILIVDDIKENIYLSETMLKGSGYEAVSATNGAEALEKLRAEDFDMIVSDILMPVMDGFRLCQECKEDEKLKDIPFVFYTATYKDERDEEFGLKLGADKFLIKPMEPEEFIKIIQGIFRDLDKGKVGQKKPVVEGEKEILKLYSQRLIEKLEKKMMDLEAEIAKRKRAEEELRRSSEQWNTTFDTIPDLISIHNKDYRIAKVNKAFADTFKMKPEEIIGKYCYELVHDTKQPWPDCPHRQAMDTRQTAVSEFMEPHLGIYIETVCSPITNEAGEVSSTVHIVRDISDRKQFERDLKERVKELQTAYGIDNITATPNITTDEICRKAVNLLPQGWQYPEITGAKITLSGKEFKTRNYRNTEWKLSSGIKLYGVKAGEVQVVYLEEKPELNTGPFQKEEGKLINSIAAQLARAIEAKQSEEALMESEQNFRNSLDNSPLGIRIVTAERELLYANQAILDIYGYSNVEELKATPVIERYTPEIYDEYLERKEKRKLGKTVPPTYEINIVRKDGEIRHLTVFRKEVMWNGQKQFQVICQDITERKKAGETLQFERDKLTGILDSMEDGICITNSQYEVKYVNPVIETQFGPVKGRKCYEYLHDREEVCPWCPNQAVFAGETVRWEWYSAKNQRTYDLIDTPLENADGSISKLEIFRDITERKLAEEALNKEATRRRILIEQSRDGIVVLEEDGGVYEANQRFSEMLGYSPEEILQLHVWDWEFLFTREQLQDISRDIDETGYSFETKHIRKDGTTYDVSISTNGTLFTGQKLIFCVCRDITERKQTEEELRIKDSAIASSINAVTISDLEGNHTYANPSFLKLWGYDDENEVLGRQISEFAQITEDVASAMKSLFNEGGWRGESVARRKDGSTFDVQVSTSLVKDKAGKPICIMASFVDITERKQIQEQLLVNDRLDSIGELVSGVAHELNNPLTGVIGFSDLLVDRKDLPDDIKEDIQIINREAKRTANIVKNLLTFARKQPKEKQLTDINKAIETILELRAYEQKVSNIQVDTRFASDLPEIMGNAFDLQQAFLNIIVNAEHAMLEAHGKGTITITTERDGDIIRASVTDDGPGIPEKNLGHVFDPFFTTKEVGKGTGLGLSICYGTITEHGGKIYAESELGKGTTFIIELPVVTTDNEGATNENS